MSSRIFKSFPSASSSRLRPLQLLERAAVIMPARCTGFAVLSHESENPLPHFFAFRKVAPSPEPPPLVEVPDPRQERYAVVRPFFDRPIRDVGLERAIRLDRLIDAPLAH